MKTRAKEKIRRVVGISPSRSRPACLSYQSDLHLFPPDPRTPQCCRFRKCSVAIAKSVSARLRARAAGIGPSIRFPRYKRDATTAAAFSSRTSPHRAYLSAAPSYYLFAFLSHAVCRTSLSLSDLCLASPLAKFFPTLSPRRVFSGEIFRIFTRRGEVIIFPSFILFLFHLMRSSYSYMLIDCSGSYVELF